MFTTRKSSPPSLRANVSFAQLLPLFVRLFTLAALADRLQHYPVCFYERLWCPLVTLWYLVWQRLQADGTMEAVVQDLRRGGADALARRRPPPSQAIRSRATTGYSDARQRLPLAWVADALVALARQLLQPVQGLHWHGLAVRLLDGSTLRLRPLGDIPKVFGRHGNQHQKSYWCLMRVVGAFCLGSGLVVAATVGALSRSEQALAVQLMLAHGRASELWVGDRNFGVWRVVRAATQSGGHLLVRLTASRARCLAGRRLRPGLDQRVRWEPSRHDQVDPGLERAAVVGRLLVAVVRRRGFRPQTLLLFTTLVEGAAYPAVELLELYGHRWEVELNFRYLKAELGLAQLAVKSTDLAQKEFYAGLIAYNLIRGVMLAAALQSGQPVGRLSFAGARRLVREALRDWGRQRSRPAQRRRLAELLEDVAACRLPRRQKPRPAEPHRKWHLRETFPPMRGSRATARRQLKNEQMKS